MRPRRKIAPPSALGWTAALLTLAACSGSPVKEVTQVAPTQTGAPATGPAAGFVPDTKPRPKVNWVEVVVPKGTALSLSMLDRLSSSASKAGDQFRARVTRGIEAGGRMAIPEGSNVQGQVMEATPAKSVKVGKGGSLVLAFTWIGTPTGATAGIAARVSKLGAEGRKAPGALTQGPSGSALTALKRGTEAVLEPESSIVIILEEPLHIKVKAEGGSS